MVAVGVGFVLGRIELEQEIAGLDVLALDDADLDDPAGDLGADVDVLLGLDLPGGRDDGGQVVFLDLADGHLDRLLAPRAEVGHDDHAQGQQDGQDDQQLFMPPEKARFFGHGNKPFLSRMRSFVYYTTEFRLLGSGLPLPGRIGKMVGK